MKIRKKLSGGFTLVELLVVTVILSILAALLSPALRSARDSARTIQCVNNLRQCGLAMLQYAEESEGKVLIYQSWATGTEKGWSTPLIAGGYIKDTRAMLCPSQPPKTWVSGKQYGIYNSSDSVDDSFVSLAGPYWYRDLNRINNLSIRICLADSIYPIDNAGYPNQCWQFKNTAISGNATVHLRHQGRAACVFFDNHAELTEYATLKKAGLVNGRDKDGNVVVF
ncbi:MAG: type II secretion system protein [Verrucomicrobiae bacterium]|nr:type II secretion system protein [Verrucomicrobiae bacterium]